MAGRNQGLSGSQIPLLLFWPFTFALGIQTKGSVGVAEDTGVTSFASMRPSCAERSHIGQADLSGLAVLRWFATSAWKIFGFH